MPSLFSSSQSNRNEIDIRNHRRHIDHMGDLIADLQSQLSVLQIVSSTQREDNQRLERDVRDLRAESNRDNRRHSPVAMATPVTINIQPVCAPMHSPPPTNNHASRSSQLIARANTETAAGLYAMCAELGNKGANAPFRGVAASIKKLGTLDERRAFMVKMIKHVYG